MPYDQQSSFYRLVLEPPYFLRSELTAWHNDGRHNIVDVQTLNEIQCRGVSAEEVDLGHGS